MKVETWENAKRSPKGNEKLSLSWSLKPEWWPIRIWENQFRATQELRAELLMVVCDMAGVQITTPHLGSDRRLWWEALNRIHFPIDSPLSFALFKNSTSDAATEEINTLFVFKNHLKDRILKVEGRVSDLKNCHGIFSMLFQSQCQSQLSSFVWFLNPFDLCKESSWAS